MEKEKQLCYFGFGFIIMDKYMDKIRNRTKSN